MVAMRPSTLLAALLISSVTAPLAAHSLASVNDPLSHGTLGDLKLSLVEAILLNMRLITEGDLSESERAQLGGTGTDIAYIDIDFTKVPVLTFERDLPLVLPTLHGLVISGSRGRPVINIGATNGFVAVSDFYDLRNLEIRGGAWGATVLQPNSFYGSTFENVRFAGQSAGAVRLVMQQDQGFGRFQVSNCTFDNVPIGLDIESGSNGRDDLVIVEDCAFLGGQKAMSLRVGALGKLETILERNRVVGTSSGFAIERLHAGSDRAVTLTSTHDRISGGGTALKFVGHANGASAVTVRAADFAASQQTLDVGPAGANTAIVVEDLRLSGKVDLRGGATRSVTVNNARMVNSTLTLGSIGGAVSVIDSILDNVVTTTSDTAPLTIAGSRFIGGSVQGSANAAVVVRDSHVGTVSVGANVTVTNALAAAQLGTMDVTPLDPQIGTTLTWSTDLPPQLSGVWMLGLTTRRPLIGPPPLHLYFEIYLYVTLSGVVRGRTQVPVAIPADPMLIGADLFLQLAVVPDAGFAAPYVSLPPGRRFVIR